MAGTAGAGKTGAGTAGAELLAGGAAAESAKSGTTATRKKEAAEAKKKMIELHLLEKAAEEEAAKLLSEKKVEMKREAHVKAMVEKKKFEDRLAKKEAEILRKAKKELEEKKQEVGEGVLRDGVGAVFFRAVVVVVGAESLGTVVFWGPRGRSFWSCSCLIIDSTASTDLLLQDNYTHRSCARRSRAKRRCRSRRTGCART